MLIQTLLEHYDALRVVTWVDLEDWGGFFFLEHLRGACSSGYEKGKKLCLWAEDWKRTPWWFLLFCLPLSWREIFLLLHVATIQLRCVISASKRWTQSSRETKSLWAPALGASLASILAWLTSSAFEVKRCRSFSGLSWFSYCDGGYWFLYSWCFLLSLITQKLKYLLRGERDHFSSAVELFVL